MHREAINPDSLFNSVEFGFSHGILQRGGTTLHLSGQVAWDRDRNLVGAGSLAVQTAQALANLRAVLAEAGAMPADVVRIRAYIVDYRPDNLETVGPLLAEFFGGAAPPASTVVGVQALAFPEFLIEIEATASLP